jgi:hypothetical protein
MSNNEHRAGGRLPAVSSDKADCQVGVLVFILSQGRRFLLMFKRLPPAVSRSPFQGSYTARKSLVDHCLRNRRNLGKSTSRHFIEFCEIL